MSMHSFLAGGAANLWASGQAEHYVARGLYDFAASREDELSFKAGDTLRVAPKGESLHCIITMLFKNEHDTKY